MYVLPTTADEIVRITGHDFTKRSKIYYSVYFKIFLIDL